MCPHRTAHIFICELKDTPTFPPIGFEIHLSEFFSWPCILNDTLTIPFMDFKARPIRAAHIVIYGLKDITAFPFMDLRTHPIRIVLICICPLNDTPTWPSIVHLSANKLHPPLFSCVSCCPVC